MANLRGCVAGHHSARGVLPPSASEWRRATRRSGQILRGLAYRRDAKCRMVMEALRTAIYQFIIGVQSQNRQRP